MSKKKRMVDGVKFKKHQPTNLTFEDLHTWTIWQFPRKVQGGLCGAVHPPIPEHGWLPTVINVKEKKVQVYANLDHIFTTPEEAAKFLES